jgi:DNA-binding XRE family transcriptional regulator
MWTVTLSYNADKAKKALPEKIQAVFLTLAVEIEKQGPVRGNWPNYSALDKKKIRHHCHLKRKPWRESFSEISDKKLPGKILAGARYREGITQTELSKLTGVPQRHISEMESGKRSIGKENAKKLARALNVATYRIFL